MKTLLIALTLFTAVAAHAQNPCAEMKRGRSGTLGIQAYRCRGGSCLVNAQSPDGTFAHYFSTEPVVEAVLTGRELRDGDVLVSVDGVPVTSVEAGRRLANLEPDVPVRLRIRRDGSERDVVAVPRLGCEAPSLQVVAVGPAKKEKVPATPKPDFGMSLDCGGCGWETVDGQRVWHSLTVPRVAKVDRGGPADVAGIRIGDRILSINGYWTFEPKDGAAIGSLKPGQKVKVVVARGNNSVELWVVTK